MKSVSTLFLSSIVFIFIHHAFYSQQYVNWLEGTDPVQHRKLYLHTDREYYFQGDSVWFKAYYLDGQSNQFVSGLYTMFAELVENTGRIIDRQVFPVDNGVSLGYLSINDSIEPGSYVLRAYTDFLKSIGEDAFFHKTLEISRVRSSFELTADNSVKNQPEIDLAFLPEGGFLLAGQMNTIGVKAIDETGRGISLKGEVLDSKGNLVTSFDTKYKGLDKIYFSPKEGETYEVNLPGFPDYKYVFKDIVTDGIKLEFTGELGDELLFLAITNSESFLDRIYYFAIMHRGEVLFYTEFVQQEKVFPIKVDRTALAPGINRFVLLDKQFLPISERLCFSKNFEVNDLTIRSDQDEYGTRSKVQLEIVDEEETRGSYSSLSVAVVDESAAGENGPSINILSWLLIDSELKGNIESPAGYFVDDEDISSEKKLNLLMLTQGWSRYLWNTIPEKDISPDLTELEGISIKGSVEQVIGRRPVVNGRVELKIYNNDYYISEEVPTDKNGRFFLDNIYFTDTAAVFIQAQTSKGKLNTKVFLEPVFEESPPISKQFLPAGISNTDFSAELNQQQYYNEKALRDYILESGSILLEEVSVYEQRREPDDGHFRIYGKPPNSYKITDRDLAYRNIFEYLGPRVSGMYGAAAISFFGGGGKLCLLNGNEVEPEVLESIPMSDIDVVDVINHYDIGRLAMFGTRAAGGAISVFTKSGGADYSEHYTPGTITAKIAGYSSYREFYSPQYTPENIDSEKPDHRLSLYWEPDVITEDGRAVLSFYTSDDISRYKIYVEGITSRGEICLGTSEFTVKKPSLSIQPDNK